MHALYCVWQSYSELYFSQSAFAKPHAVSSAPTVADRASVRSRAMMVFVFIMMCQAWCVDLLDKLMLGMMRAKV